jgi:dienelactone hydrolase
VSWRKALLLVASGFLLLVAFIAAPVLYPGQRTSVNERIGLLEPSFNISLPEGDGPFPAVLMFHGCGGLVGPTAEKDIMDNYAREATESGYVAIIVDSFTPRAIDFDDAIGRVCSGLALRGRTRAGDVVAAVAYAKSRDDIDKSAIVLAGWSHGGWTVIEAMTMDMADTWPAALERPESNVMDDIRGVYLTYPYCGFPSTGNRNPWVQTPLTSVVVAENDTVVGLEKCIETLQFMDASGVPLEVEVFRHVTHAFDESDQTDESSFVYVEAEAQRAINRFGSFLSDVERDAPFPNPDRFFVDVPPAGTSD